MSSSGHKKRNFNKEKNRPTKRHPPHLKGKEIGLFYAKQNKKSAEESIKLISTINISNELQKKIKKVLRGSDNFSGETDSKNYSHVKDSLFKRKFLKTISESIGEKLAKGVMKSEQNYQIDENYLKEFKEKQHHPKYQAMIQVREKLPSFKKKDEILQLIEDNQVVVISGETGCGKTTQVAQFILDNFIENSKGSLCKILCTQPRRISAISVAERVAEERFEKLGQSVGFQIRLESVLPRSKGSILFCTTGIVLKTMETDPNLSHVSHLILDEIHERDVLSDFTLALIKKVIKQRKDLKVILMSATINSEKFSKYYFNAPHINIPGFTYPVKEYYLEDVLQRTGYIFKDYRKVPNLDFQNMILPHIRNLEDIYPKTVLSQLKNPFSEELDLSLIFELLKDICKKEKEEGAILVFLTGYSEITNLIQMMEKSNDFPRNKYHIYPLHSILPSIEQKQIFSKPPTGVRKIIISTNIAETSITIDDVVYVIDCGKIKISNFDIQTNTQTLNAEWVSLANARQRKGRAGRVKSGICFHLFSKARELCLDEFQLPEILRKRLEDVILTAKVLQLGNIDEFFKFLIDPPDPLAIDLSLDLLKRLNALDNDENLTPLGYHLARLPIGPQIGKMILFGAIFSCLDPILSIAATLDFKDAFQTPIGKMEMADKKKIRLANGLKSDHLLFHEVLKIFESCPNPRQFCWENFLSYQTCKLLIDMKKQLMGYLYEMQFVSNSDPNCLQCNKNSDNLSVIKSVIAAGLYPNILISKFIGKPPLFSINNKKFKIHLKSILAQEKHFQTRFLVYYVQLKTQGDFIHDATPIDSLPIIFFGDNFQIEDDNNCISINKKLRFRCTNVTANLLKDLRDRFNWFLEYKISHPGPINWDDPGDEIKLLEMIMYLIGSEDCGDLECYDLESELSD